MIVTTDAKMFTVIPYCTLCLDTTVPHLQPQMVDFSTQNGLGSTPYIFSCRNVSVS
jgi:hypothetical protein